MKLILPFRTLGLNTSSHRRQNRAYPLQSLAPLEPRVVLSHAAAAVVHEATAATLSPPWNTYRSELAETVGMTPGVKVSPLIELADGNYLARVSTKTANKAAALASVLASSQSYGNVTVQVEVSGPGSKPVSGTTPSTAQQLAKMEDIALAGNKMYVKTVVGGKTPISADSVFPVFTKSVVQFSNDNLADLYQNRNLVAAGAFTDVLAPDPGGIEVSPSTTI